jgi:hypothetical protein
MKTKEELIYDFMLALAANPSMTPSELQPEAVADMIHTQAVAMAFQYLENL